VLKRLNLPATIFLTTGFIDTNLVFWPERVIRCFTNGCRFDRGILADVSVPLAIEELIEAISEDMSPRRLLLLDRLVSEMKQLVPDVREVLMNTLFSPVYEQGLAMTDLRVMLDWSEAIEMNEAGITFGSHGVSHELLTMISSEQQEWELRESRSVIEDKLGKRVDALAYPNGNNDDIVKRLAQQAGYRCAMAVTSSHVTLQTDRYTLGRVNVHQGNSSGVFGRFSKALFSFHIQRVLS
jgi:peptidoglycan/xylan/chitin deacetylase (PgdA/CDA1 family)